MSILEKVANKALENYTKIDGAEKAVDPALILNFIEILGDVIVLIKKCKKQPEEGLQMVKSPTFLQEGRLRLIARRSLDRADRKYGKDVTKALLSTGNKLSIEEMKDLYRETDDE